MPAMNANAPLPSPDEPSRPARSRAPEPPVADDFDIEALVPDFGALTDDGPPIPGWDDDRIAPGPGPGATAPPSPKPKPQPERQPNLAANPTIRDLPHSIDAEKIVIGGLLFAATDELQKGPEWVREQFAKVDRIVSPRDFYDVSHKIIAEAIAALAHAGEPFDPLTVQTRLEDTGKLEKLPGRGAYLAELWDAAPGVSNIEHYAAMVHNRAERRRFIAKANRAVEKAFGGNDDEYHNARAALEIGTGRNHGKREYISIADAGEPEAVPWLWRHWLPGGHFTLLAGRGGSGKGVWWAHCAACVTGKLAWPGESSPRDPRTVLVFSQEDTLLQVLKPRLIAAGADRALVKVDSDGFGGSADIDEIAARFANHSPPLGLVVIDPIEGLMEAGGNSNRSTEVRALIKPFVSLAEQTNAAILGVHHINKWAKATEGAAIDLVRGSSAWTDCARMVWMLARDETDEDTHSRVLIRAKSNLPGRWYDEGVRITGETFTQFDAPGIETVRITDAELVGGNAEKMFLAAVKGNAVDAPEPTPAEAEVIDYLNRQPGGKDMQAKIISMLCESGSDSEVRTLRRTVDRVVSKGFARKREPVRGEFNRPHHHRTLVIELYDAQRTQREPT